MAHKILLVEDEENLASAILLNLDLEGYETTWIKNGNSAENNLLSQPNFFDLVILDVMLPERDGFSICKNLRSANISTPVLFLSARNSSKDKVEGLKAGADDYLGKPFNLEELLLRIQILLRRQTPNPSNSSNFFSIGAAVINPNSLQIEFDSKAGVKLTHLEYKFLEFLKNNTGRVVSREDILENVWQDKEVSARTIDNFIVKFRKWFEVDPKSPKHFISVRGVGYRFEN